MNRSELIAGRGLLVVERRRAVRHGRQHLLPAIDALLTLVGLALEAFEPPPPPVHVPRLRRRFAPTEPMPTVFEGVPVRGDTALATLLLEDRA